MQSAEGEPQVAQVLARELRDTETTIIHSLPCRAAGGMDHVAIGPGGVTVIAARRRSPTISAAAGTLRQHPRIGQREVARVARQRLAIRLALAHVRPELRNVNVLGILCLARDEARSSSPLEDGVMLCGAVAAARIADRPGDLDVDEIAELEQAIRQNLGHVSREQLDGQVSGGWAPDLPSPNLDPHPAAPSALAPRGRLGRPTALMFAVLCAVIGLGIAVFLDPHAFSAGAGAPGLSVDHEKGKSVVYVSAPRGTRVGLLVTTGRVTHVAYLHSRGKELRWVVPAAWNRAASVTVAACAVNAESLCIGAQAFASNQPIANRGAASRASP
jgi:hypothetical protein